MKFHSNVRLVNLSKYEPTITDICSQDNLNNIVSISDSMGDIDNAKRGLNYYNNPLIHYIEDSSYIHGNMYAFDLNTNIEDIYNGLKAFKEADDIDRARVLVAFGYNGTSFGPCSYGERLFFGYRDRWDDIFRHTSGREYLKTVFSSFVGRYKVLPDIKAILAEKSKDIKEDGRKIEWYHFFCEARSFKLWKAQVESERLVRCKTQNYRLNSR